MEKIIKKSAVRFLLAQIKEAKGNPKESYILLDVGTNEGGNTEYQVVSIEKEEISDKLMRHYDPSGLTFFLEREKAKYFEGIELSCEKVSTDSGDQKLLVFKPVTTVD